MTTTQPSIPDIKTLKARQKSTWESGDFGEVAKFIMPHAEEFMARIPLQPGMKVLDAACGTGNLAVLAAQRGCVTSGLDFAANLIAQARERASQESLSIDFTEGDAEAMPYPDASFDVVVSMWGVMFAPRPELVVSELRRVVKPGGLIGMANWSPDGFIGKMFVIFARHLPPPAGFPSPLLWGDESVVRARFHDPGEELRLTRQTANMRFPFDPAGTVDFFRRYYGPTNRAFESLKPDAQAALLRDLVELQSRHNISKHPDQTETPSDYLEVHVRRRTAPRK
jgi:SAM-dependent methyltransferase